eukprot:gb/GEZJ01003420.1/.p1 GENE.gb/GEZJ01003420.1/~~gb/GEZJ01003420.1/.p1  ORF type:complete len:162 (-),score=11.34 gb/GEZJ01003420.1/:403-888(-)
MTGVCICASTSKNDRRKRKNTSFSDTPRLRLFQLCLALEFVGVVVFMTGWVSGSRKLQRKTCKLVGIVGEAQELSADLIMLYGAQGVIEASKHRWWVRACVRDDDDENDWECGTRDGKWRVTDRGGRGSRVLKEDCQGWWMVAGADVVCTSGTRRERKTVQ